LKEVIKNKGDVFIMEKLFQKYGKGKVYLITAILLITINMMISFFANEAYTSFTIDDEKFKYVFQEANIILFEGSDGNEIIVNIKESRDTFFDIATIYEVNYKDKVTKFDGSDFMNKGIVITLFDGSEYIKEFLTISFDGENKSSNNIPFEVKLINSLNETYGRVEESFLKVTTTISIPIILMGLGLIIYPKEWWRFKYMFSVSGGEPTELAIFSNIAGGVILIGLVMFMHLYIILKG